MPQAVTVPDKIEPLARSLVPLVLPEVAVKLALGAKTGRTETGMTVALDGETVALAEPDFDLAARAARKVRSKLPAEITVSAILAAQNLAHKYVTEELFRPGAVRVLYYAARTKASAFYRCLLPSLVMNTHGSRVTAFVSGQGVTREALDYDVVVFQLAHSPGVVQFAKALQSMGKKVVFEIDDAYDQLDGSHGGYQRYDTTTEHVQINDMLGLANLVTVTTQALADHYGSRAKSIRILPNYIPLGDWPKAGRHETGEFRVVWAGSPSHLGDLALVGDALWEFASARQNVRFVFFGREPVGVPESLRERVQTHPFCDFEDYPQKLADFKADLAIAPLADVSFSHYKSNLKLLEYGAVGYPIVASRVGPYAGSDGAILVATPGEWQGALAALYSNEILRTEMRHRAMMYAQDFDAERNVAKLEDVFVELTKS